MAISTKTGRINIMHFVENKVTDLHEYPPEGVVKLGFNASGACLMCGHTPGQAMTEGKCCPCEGCVCCTKRSTMRPEES